MKRIKYILLLFILLGVSSSFAQDKEVKIRVDGLSCPFCAYGLEKKLNDIEGVENIHIDFEKGLVTLNIVGSQKISENEIKSKVKEAGFTPKKIEISDFKKTSTKTKQ